MSQHWDQKASDHMEISQSHVFKSFVLSVTGGPSELMVVYNCGCNGESWNFLETFGHKET